MVLRRKSHELVSLLLSPLTCSRSQKASAACPASWLEARLLTPRGASSRLAAHIDQVKAAARELADRDDILAMDFCRCVRGMSLIRSIVWTSL
jgi:hypothetical protein